MPTTSPIIEPSREVWAETRSKRTYVWALAVVWLVSLVYMAAHVKRGWVPHDEGTLGLSAERVLQGQLPHRDFDDYTGGLTFLHALAFRLFGINSASMRMVLFAFFVPWVPAVFYAASRFCGAYSAGVVTLLAVTWSVPHYPGPMPSWYNLFFATFGLAALLRYLETNSWKWVFLAGLCGGFSMLAKVTGAYYIAAALLFFVFREQSLADKERRGTAIRGWFYSSTVALMLTIFLLLLFRMVHRVPGAGGLFFFVFPSVLLAGSLIVRELRGVSGKSVERFKALVGMCTPFLTGALLPCAIFAIPFVAANASHQLVQGLFAAPARALRFAAIAPLSPLGAVAAIPFLLPLFLAFDARGRVRMVSGIALGTISGAVFLLSLKHSMPYGVGWASIGTAVPLMSILGAAIIWQAYKRQGLDLERKQQVVLLLFVAALCSLVQFPFSGQGYFLYVAPLVILAAAALLTSLPAPPRAALAVLAGFYLLFGLFSVTPYHLGLQHKKYAQTESLALARAGGVQVEASAARTYEQTVAIVQSHSQSGFIYAAPDCPEIYFLAGRKSPSRHYFDYAEAAANQGPEVVDRLEALGVNIVAINREPLFSAKMSKELENELERRFPHSAETEKFTVRWKD